MVTEVSIVDLRRSLNEILEWVQDRKDGIVIKKDGQPVAALVDIGLFARIRRARERFDALTDRVADAYADVPLEKGTEEIGAAVAAERRKG